MGSTGDMEGEAAAVILLHGQTQAGGIGSAGKPESHYTDLVNIT